MTGKRRGVPRQELYRASDFTPTSEE